MKSMNLTHSNSNILKNKKQKTNKQTKKHLKKRPMALSWTFFFFLNPFFPVDI